MTATTQNIEDALPIVQYHGLNTQKNVTLGSAANFDASGSTGSFKFPSGAVSGLKEGVISGVGATKTLVAADSGSVCLFDRAAGNVYTLPAPAVGLNFTFICTVTVTSNAAEVDTSSGSVFMSGSVVLGTNDTASKSFLGNGTSHVKIASNGTTSGGIIGGSFTVVCVSATVWAVNGNLAASGTLVTPFA